MPDFLSGGGELGALMRAKDWTRTPLGPPEQWPQSLRTSVSTCLNCSFPILLWWGPDLVKLYNDAYAVILAEKHPAALGRPGREVWPEIWDTIGPMLQSAMRGEAAPADDLLLLLRRHGYAEECYFSFSYSPIHDESGGVGGIFCPVIETTAKIIGARRLQTLHELGARTVGAQSVDEACAGVGKALRGNPHDVPFAALYLLHDGAGAARRCVIVGIDRDTAAFPDACALSGADEMAWPLAAAAETREPQEVRNLPSRIGRLLAQPWPEPVETALVLPITGEAEKLAGLLIAGVSPRRALDAEYRNFFGLVAQHISKALADARAYELERKRAEALAEIDRAKTAFFSNVSHEFRTPLTLMLAPLEDALNDRGTELPAVQRERLDVAHRNSLRLLKLVNSLLDFSRIEAGRAQASYRPTDLAALTADFASSFRAAVERAGMYLEIDCHPLPQPVYVDREMWEKVVLNLLSNAFKFTFEGGITVGLRADGDHAVLVVRDTGEGIPAHELPRLFERFHRIQGQRSRSFEGSGIGLALVQELVRLHGGTISAESEPGRGTAFTITLPFGAAHLPPDRIGAAGPQVSTAARADAFVAEALNWLPEIEHGRSGAIRSEAGAVPAGKRPRVLLADDNADMRDYLRRLLGRQYDVVVVADGEEALAAIRREPPDLLVTDVMMPRLDGFGLLRAIRADPALRDLSVIVLSARAGEEARVEGLQAGADDYVVKPFAAPELLARVQTILALGAQRRAVARAAQDRAARVTELFEQAPGFMCILRGPEHVYEFANRAYLRLVGDRDLIGRTVREALPELQGQPYFDLLDRVYRSGVPYTELGARVVLRRSAQAPPEEVFVDFIYQPILDPDGSVTGIFTQGSETTERVRIEAALRESEERLRLATEAAEIGLWDVDPINDVLVWPPRVKAMFGISPDVPVSMADFYAGLHPEDREATSAAYAAAADPARRVLYDVEYRTVGKEDGIVRWVAAKGRGVFDDSGRCVRVIGTAIDITARKRAEAELRRLNETLEARVAEEIAAREEAQARLAHAQRMEALGQLAGGIAHDFNNVLQAVIGGVSLIERRAEQPESVRSLARMAADAAARGTAIAARLLAFARRGELRPAAVEPEPLLEGLREILEPTLGAGITVRIETAPRTPALLADKAQLETALVNLAVNARDAMPAGGVLTLAAKPIEVGGSIAHPAGLAPGVYVRLDVSDTGTGMDAAVLARASEPFFTTKPAGQGTGLGLAMARGFALQSGGGFEIASVRGRGTTVTLWLPKAEAAAENAASTSENELLDGQRATALVVDDDDMVRAVLAAQMAALGYKVAEASDGFVALARLDAGERPVLLVTDFSMPGMNGLMLIDEARRRLPGLPAVLLTGFADARLRDIESVHDERTIVIRKPVTEHALSERLAKFLGVHPSKTARLRETAD